MDGLTSKMMLLSIDFPGILFFCFVLLTDFPRLLPAHTFVDAVGCQYAYLYCRDKIGKMVIVGSSATTSEVENYLSWFRNNHSLQVYYIKI